MLNVAWNVCSKNFVQFTLIASTCGIIDDYNSIHYTLYIGVIKRYIASVFMIMKTIYLMMIIMLIDDVILVVMIMRGLYHSSVHVDDVVSVIIVHMFVCFLSATPSLPHPSPPLRLVFCTGLHVAYLPPSLEQLPLLLLLGQPQFLLKTWLWKKTMF